MNSVSLSRLRSAPPQRLALLAQRRVQLPRQIAQLRARPALEAIARRARFAFSGPRTG